MSSLAIRTTKSRPRATFTCSSMSLEVAQTTEVSAPPKPSSLGEAAAASVAEVSPVSSLQHAEETCWHPTQFLGLVD